MVNLISQVGDSSLTVFSANGVLSRRNASRVLDAALDARLAASKIAFTPR